jgi:hypothetical protein
MAMSNKSAEFINATLSGRWDESRVVIEVVGAGKNKRLRCDVCAHTGGPTLFLRTHRQALCDLPQIALEGAATQVGDTNPVVQSSITCARTLELLGMLLNPGNMRHINMIGMFGPGGHRYQGDAAIWSSDGQTETGLMQELIALIQTELGMTLIYCSVIITDGLGNDEEARERDQPSHKDCTPLMYGVLGPVHSVFHNLKGTRMIGTAVADIVMSPAQRTVLDGRYSHWGKGRTEAQGSHALFHAFGVVNPLTEMYTGLTAERQDYIMKHRPELDSESRSLATAWPRDNECKLCAHCSRRFMHFKCKSCPTLLCYACAPMTQLKCDKCIARKSKKSK